jgi:hypothetical protein
LVGYPKQKNVKPAPALLERWAWQAIFSGVTGLWGFSTVAFIVEACAAQMTDDDDADHLILSLSLQIGRLIHFGKNMGTMVSRGIGNAAGLICIVA